MEVHPVKGALRSYQRGCPPKLLMIGQNPLVKTNAVGWWQLPGNSPRSFAPGEAVRAYRSRSEGGRDPLAL